jgi:hypothetical protein
MRRIVEFIISQLLKAITLGLLVVSFNWNGSLFGVRSSDADHDVILARLEQLQTAAHSQRLEASTATFPMGVSSVDLVAMQDFALVTSGAFYIPLLTSQFDTTSSSSADQHKNSPNLALTMDAPGSCWKLPQSKGHLGIGFKSPVILTHISIDHPLTQSSNTMLNAPRDIVVWGFLEHDENLQRYRSVYLDVDDEPPHEVIEAARRQNPSGSFIKLVHMEYSPFDRKLPVQTFPVYQNILRAGFDFGLIVVEIRGNWGASETCLCRVRVHGKDIHDELQS